jgi:hypothetical protein
MSQHFSKNLKTSVKISTLKRGVLKGLNQIIQGSRFLRIQGFNGMSQKLGFSHPSILPFYFLRKLSDKFQEVKSGEFLKLKSLTIGVK